MHYSFSDNFKKKAEQLLGIYPQKEALIIPLLHELQRELGYLPDEAMDALADYLKVPPVRIKGVVLFYTMFNRKPVGKFHIQVCRNISCSLMGAGNIIDFLKKNLGINEGETTADGYFTLSTVECLGSCGTAPVMMVNDDYFEDLTMDKIEKLLKEFKNG